MKYFTLGMAQLGMGYGVTSQNKEYDEEQALELLEYAIEKKNITMLDSAQAYGKANNIIGRLKGTKKGLKITNKVSGDSIHGSKENDRSFWQRELEDLLEEMNMSHIETLLIHKSQNMDKENKNLTSWLEEQKRNNLITNIGVSIYDKYDLENTALEIIDVVQLPLSIYDQRATENGLIEKLNDKGIKIQTSSLFLQGLMLNDCNKWPKCIGRNLREHHIKWSNFLDSRNLTALDACINFCRSNRKLYSIVIGIDNKDQLDMIENKWNDKFLIEKKLNHEQWSTNHDVDPRLWRPK